MVITMVFIDGFTLFVWSAFLTLVLLPLLWHAFNFFSRKKRVEHVAHEIDAFVSDLSPSEREFFFKWLSETDEYCSSETFLRLQSLVSALVRRLGWRGRDRTIVINAMVLTGLIERFKLAGGRYQSLDDTVMDFIHQGFYELTYCQKTKYNEKVLQKKLVQYSDFFETALSYPLNKEQRIACLKEESRHLIVAGAGTGKTATIIARCLHLIKNQEIPADQILLLAFARKAADEIRERLEQYLGEGNAPHVSTFHAFGNRIWKESTDRQPGITRFEEQPTEFFTYITSRIEWHARHDAEYLQKLVTYLVHYGSEKLPEHSLTEGKYRTKDNKIVKSQGEQVIADLLWQWRVPYCYERRYPLCEEVYHPDFLIGCNDHDADYDPTKVLWLEFFGIDRNGNTAPNIDRETYLEGIEWKRRLHKKNDTCLIELTQADYQDHHLETRLRSLLKKHGYTIVEPTGDELLRKFQEVKEQKQNNQYRPLVDLIRHFLGLHREFPSKNIGTDAYRGNVNRLHLFLSIYFPIYKDYCNYLESRNEIDFASMIAGASDLVKTGQWVVPYKNILIDEFQDISIGREQLIQSILTQKPQVKLFCVGDDWQSIFRFTGSHVEYFTNFADHFSPTDEDCLSKIGQTYRFDDNLVRYSSSFIQKNKAQISKTLKGKRMTFSRSSPYILSVSSVGSSDANYLTYQTALTQWLESIQQLSVGKGQKEILILGRRNLTKNREVDNSLIKQLQQKFPDYRIRYSTVHAAKGLEADFTALVEVDDDIFPDLRTSDPILEIFYPTSDTMPYAEERRLFYVALTRTKNTVHIFTSAQNPSRFVLELIEDFKQDPYFMAPKVRRAALCPHCGQRLQEKKRENLTFFYCSSCLKTYLPEEIFCPYCHEELQTRNGAKICPNLNCQYVALICPDCHQGIFVEKRSRRGELFYGCTRWNQYQCRAKSRYQYERLLENWKERQKYERSEIQRGILA